MIVDTARYLQSMAKVWAPATPAERRDMVRAIFDEVICDIDANGLTVLYSELSKAVRIGLDILPRPVCAIPKPGPRR